MVTKSGLCRKNFDQVPKIPGQDTSQFQEWHWKDANKCKAIHIRFNAENVSTMQTLLEVAKEKYG